MARTPSNRGSPKGNRPGWARQSVTDDRRRLICLIRHLGYGYIENLEIRAGEPVLEPLPRIVRVVKLDADEPSPPRDGRSGTHAADRRLLDKFDEIGTGTIERIDIRRGLPCALEHVLSELPA